MKYPFFLGTALLIGLSFPGSASADDSPSPVRFSRDILPIFSENCFQCHGPDEKARKAKLRLDTREGAKRVVLPGKSAKIELLRRINASEPNVVMPPPKTNRKLTPEQRELLRRWIDQGAQWGKHWAYETPQRPTVPAVKNAIWSKNSIDSFVLARLEREGLVPSPEVARETLIRRVTFDLTGLPPTIREVEDFLADRSPEAYEKLVDRLLASPRYGERMAMDWLDYARFADTNGFQNDFARSMWPWRDWVIDAFTKNMPYDRFVVEQVAGDLLPHATLQQKIATGFNRNNRTVTEGGSIDEEWRVENAVDRVETTGTVFLGLTLGCARCHDHKFDPISQKEFYQFLGFFNSINERGVYNEQPGNVPPLVSVPTKADEERLKQFDVALAATERTVRDQEAALSEKQNAWEKEQRLRPEVDEPPNLVLRIALNGDLQYSLADEKKVDALYKGKALPTWTEGPFGKALWLDGGEQSFLELGQVIRFDHKDRFSYGGWVKSNGSGAVLSKMNDKAAYRGWDLLIEDGKVVVHLVHSWPNNALKVATQEALPQGSWSHVFATYDGSGKAAGMAVYVNGRIAKHVVLSDQLKDVITTNQPLRLGRRSTAFSLNGELADIRAYGRNLTAKEVEALSSGPMQKILRIAAKDRSKAQQEMLVKLFRDRYAVEWMEAQRAATKLRHDRIDYQKQIPTVMIMEDLPKPRDTFLLKRGRYDMPDTSQKLQPGVPSSLPALPADVPRNRLSLARWLVDSANPLTARVSVNRFWQHYFGTGFVKSTENFGLQSELPSHLDLLDWLSTEFIRMGWDVKAMQKLIVMSATYRQSSKSTAESLLRDPENRLLARGPRTRLPAEMVRDNALAISGLLVDKIGGPSVRPYQPAGLWEELAGGAGEGPYNQEKGANLYRRSLYIYRKRTVPHPTMTTFDAPSREVCQVKRSRTNTPLQALELMNDITYLEASRKLAELMLTQEGKSAEQRLAYAFRRATARTPTKGELQVLALGLEQYRKTFSADVEEARRFVRHGDSPVNDKLDVIDLAAYTAVASVILNLDETISKE